MMMRSASVAILSLSSSDTPGSVPTLMVNEPSLNDGRNERPMVQKPTAAAANITATEVSINLVCEMVKLSSTM